MRVRNIYWILSFLLTFLFLLILMKHLNKINRFYQADDEQVDNSNVLNEYINAYKQNNKNKDLFYIPTGLFVQSIKWLDSQSFFISGYLWEKFPLGEKRVSPGFVLPEATEFKKKLAYQFSDDKTQTIGWYFEGKIFQRFDYANYPFDLKTIKIRLWHDEFSQKVLLIPDLDAYESTRPHDKFGLDPHIVLSGFDILETYFRFYVAHYDTNFGIGSALQKKLDKGFPELYFNVVLKRKPSEALIVYLLPLLLVFIISFCALLAMTFDSKKREIFDFHYLDVLTLCAALFFVVLLSHIHLREAFHGVGIIYIEYIYVIAYLCIAYVTVNAFLVVHAEFTGHRIYQVVYYEDNLIAKVLFLPLFSALALLVSLYFF